MRIRKNANISELLKATSSSNTQKPVQIHNCQLNQSPWDVISNFLPQRNSPPPPPSPLYQVNGSGSLAINGSSLDSIMQRFNLQLDDNKEFNGTCRKRDYSGGDNEENQRDMHKSTTNLCRKTDGKGWQCKNEADTGSSMCKHHSSLERKYNDKKQVVLSETTKRRHRPKKGNPSNPYEFYYYSGFGPRWSKKRSKSNDSGIKNSEDELGIEPMAALYKFVQDDLDYGEKDDDKMKEKHERKRMRKPVKERSLKSLM